MSEYLHVLWFSISSWLNTFPVDVDYFLRLEKKALRLMSWIFNYYFMVPIK